MAPSATSHARAQRISRNEQGLNELQASNMKLVTDLPIDDELEAWPDYLAQAVVQWQTFFAAPTSRVSAFLPTIYLVGDKERWRSLGLLQSLPVSLQDGFQHGLDLYVVEQPSIYYRRLLFLHEATHGVMYSWLGGVGAPWLAEGLADHLGTHSLIDGQLKLGYFPSSAEEVPHWGRIRLIHESLEQGTAPTLSELVRIPDMQTDRMLRYAWSWALCTFLLSHPELREEFKTIYQGPLRYDMEATGAFLNLMKPRWNELSMQWRCFVDDLDFGMNADRTALTLTDLKSDRPQEFSKGPIAIAADRGWQLATAPMSKGAKLSITCSGRIVVRDRSKNAGVQNETVIPSTQQTRWESESLGISVEYIMGNRLGALVGTWASAKKEQPTERWPRFKVVPTMELESPAEDSILLLRVNDRGNNLADNQGEYLVNVKSSNE